jgi:linoleoyl-CoA desaturase
VNQRVEAIPENRDIYIQIKAIILPLIYFGLYVFALLMLINIGFIFEFCFNGNFFGFDLFEFNS